MSAGIALQGPAFARFQPQPTRVAITPRLTPKAIAITMRPVRTCAGHLCAGVATEDHFVIFRTSMRTAQAIEMQRTWRGVLSGHIDAVLVACSAIHDRAMASGTWSPVEINFNEQDAIKEMVELYELQLHKLTVDQLTAAVRVVIADALGDVHHFHSIREVHHVRA